MKETLEEQLEKARRLLSSYQELAIDQEDDDAFMAMQIAQLTARVADLEKEKMRKDNL